MRRPISINVDEHLLDTLAALAREEGVDEDQLVEEALRRYFGLRGLALLEDLSERRQQVGALSDDEAMAMAVDEVRKARAQRRLDAG